MLSRKLPDAFKQQQDVVGSKKDFHWSELQQIEINNRGDKVRRVDWTSGKIIRINKKEVKVK